MKKTYIIHIYQEDRKSGTLIGTLEEVDSGKRTCFHDRDELWFQLCQQNDSLKKAPGGLDEHCR